jgi:hypothetical protein
MKTRTAGISIYIYLQYIYIYTYYYTYIYTYTYAYISTIFILLSIYTRLPSELAVQFSRPPPIIVKGKEEAVVIFCYDKPAALVLEDQGWDHRLLRPAHALPLVLALNRLTAHRFKSTLSSLWSRARNEVLHGNTRRETVIGSRPETVIGIRRETVIGSPNPTMPQVYILISIYLYRYMLIYNNIYKLIYTYILIHTYTLKLSRGITDWS